MRAQTGTEEETPKEVPIVLRIDGPFGAPAEAVWGFKTVMLVGAGIGVTPFASIIRSWNLQRAMMRRGGAGRMIQVEKIYFYWICRGMEEFHWFIDLLADAVKGGSEGLDFNLFATGEIKLSDLDTPNLAKVSGVLPRDKQHFGRPNWKRIYKEVKDKHNGTPEHPTHVGAFLCGPPPVRVELENAARLFSDDSMKFSVHAESF